MSTNKENTISSYISTANLIVLLVLAIMGYLVSSDVREIQESSDRRANAKEVKEFWEDMHQFSIDSGDKAGKLGSSLTKYLIYSGELLDVYNRYYPFKDKSEITNNLQYQLAYANFLGAYGGLISAIESIAIDYDYTRLKYHQLAIENELPAWEQFFNQSKEVIEWKNGISTDIQEIYNLTHNTVSELNSIKGVPEKLQFISTSMGKKLQIFSIPHLKGLNNFSAANLEKMKKSLG